jgi:hypothetical protein
MNFPNAKEIFTTGVPKSGNTWLNRLLSDMFQAPLQNNHDEPVEYYGINHYRDNYVIRKLHMPYDPELSAYHCYDDNIRERCKKGTLIYIQRDPRAVMVSAMHYRGQNDLAGVIKQQCREYKPHATQNAYEAWCNSYLEHPENCDYIVKYEDLHKQPIEELQNIFGIVTGKSIQDSWIEQVIERQSFDNVKNEDKHFYFKGKPDTWKRYFNYETGKYITEKLGEFMLKNDYISSLNWYKNWD